MNDVRTWLEGIGLAQYANAFETNEIGMDLLSHVDDQMLKDLGVSIGGHRLLIRNAIAKLNAISPPAANQSAAKAASDALESTEHYL